MVKTKIAQSDINGFGLFADESISKGTLVWQEGLIDQEISVEQINSFPIVAKEFMSHFGSETRPGVFSLCGDDARFINHSDEPNISAIGSQGFALSDIAVGQEITCNYKEFDIRSSDF